MRNLTIRLLAAWGLVLVVGLPGLAVQIPVPAPVAKKQEPAASESAGSALTARRIVLRDEGLILHVPLSWKDGSWPLSYDIGDLATVRVLQERVPDGYSSDSYADAMTRQFKIRLREMTEPVALPARIAGRTATELNFVTTGPDGRKVRFVFVATTAGEIGTAFMYYAPIEAPVSTVRDFRIVTAACVCTTPDEIDEFTELVKELPAETGGSPLATRDALIRVIDGIDVEARRSAVAALVDVARTSPLLVAEGILDGRPIVRASSLEALVATGQPGLGRLVEDGLFDKDPLVRERTARAISRSQQAIADLLESYPSAYFVGDSRGFTIAS
ncbi:MAG: hypothetical protein IT175_00650, partial [Acidobacteria bacterium]|nr:hypothetical protein [Acidobacteriota bacterium]